MTKIENDLEFGGSPGALITIIMMPTVVYLLNYYCDQEVNGWSAVLDASLDPVAWMILCAYLAWLALTFHIVPGNTFNGTMLANGKRLKYKCNGLNCLLLTLILFWALWYCGVPVNTLHRRTFGLITCATVLSFIISIKVYLNSFLRQEQELSFCGNTGLPAYDFYLGRELNPSICGIDVKFLFELRPGLIGWVLLDLSFIAEWCQRSDTLPWTLICVTCFHAIYVLDALYFEEAVLSTFDITTEGFGFMLCFGNLTFVPFTFSLQARYLLHNQVYWSRLSLSLLFFFNCVGYLIFRLANNQKDEYKREPYSFIRRKKCVESQDGSQALYSSGLWGMVRHPNYLGDVIMAIMWCCSCGLGSVLPWFYALYLIDALKHRCARLEKRSEVKYGALWAKYCLAVPYRIIPGVY